MIVDTDIHCMLNGKAIARRLPQPWRYRMEHGGGNVGGTGHWNPNGVNRADAVAPDGMPIAADPKHLGELFFSVHGIDFGVLNPGGVLGWGVHPEPDYAAAACRGINDTLIEDWLSVDDRFRGSVCVAPTDPAQAAKEIRRVGDHPQMVQVLMTSAGRIPYGNRLFWPIYEAAEEMGLPLGIHPGKEGTGISNPPSPAGYTGSYFEWHSVLAANYIGQLVSLVTEGVFQKFPKFTFILIEGGVSWLPAMMWRLDKNWKALRSTAPWLDRPPSRIIPDHLRLTTQPLEEPENKQHFHQILAMFPAEKMLMFSTDFPHWDGDTPDFAGRWFPDHLRDRVMSGTAIETYKLPVPAPA